MKLLSHNLLLIAVAYLATAIIGCSTFTSIDEYQELDPKVLYMPDLEVEVDGKNYGSWGVLPEKFPPKIKVKSPGDIDQMRVSTCSRTEMLPKKTSWFASDKAYKYEFTPSKEESQRRIELGESCGILIETFEEGKPGRHSWGLFDFEDSKNYKAKAKVSCCGKDIDFNGVSGCICEDGKLSSIEFDQPMKVYSDEKKCEDGWEVLDGGRYYRRYIASRDCPYLFISTDEPVIMHRHTQIGVEAFPVRGD